MSNIYPLNGHSLEGLYMTNERRDMKIAISAIVSLASSLMTKRHRLRLAE